MTPPAAGVTFETDPDAAPLATGPAWIASTVRFRDDGAVALPMLTTPLEAYPPVAGMTYVKLLPPTASKRLAAAAPAAA